jgi:hypothetical protein
LATLIFVAVAGLLAIWARHFTTGAPTSSAPTSSSASVASLVPFAWTFHHRLGFVAVIAFIL